MSIKIHLPERLAARHVIRYTLQLLAGNKGLEFVFTPISDADLGISANAESDIPLCLPFYDHLLRYDFLKLKELAVNSYLFHSADGKKDYLASIFYLVNCLQEYAEPKTDKYGRYPYAESIQYSLTGGEGRGEASIKERILHQNIVQSLMDEFISTHPRLCKLNTTSRRSSFFLSHDIDTVFGAKNQNGDYALKTRQYHKIPGILWRHYMGRPDWINMDRIMDMEAAFGFSSTFYWLVHRDRENADYDILNPRILLMAAMIEKKGFENGLHKSLSHTSFEEELRDLKVIHHSERTTGQRYHFLRFNLPQAWADIEAAGLKLDTSLGFSEDFGFRNSYGLPFMPYHLKENRVYDLIEVPMTIMDRTFFNQNKPVTQIENELITWLDKNRENAVITLNFHNNFFDRMLYAGYDRLYMTLLRYFKEEGMRCMTQKSLIQEFYKPEVYAIRG